MKLLSICIPNYNRIVELERLVREIAGQLIQYKLTEQVEVCISDDCSTENPETMAGIIREEYPQVEIRFERNSRNRGMDYNFLKSVMMASGEYCWIIGNDDLPEEGGIARIVAALGHPDIIITPFDVYGTDGNIQRTVYPLDVDRNVVFDTSFRDQYSEFLLSVRHNSGIYGFLSNTVFRKCIWMTYKGRFRDKMDTIFIQMYMNIQAMEDGTSVLYLHEKIIRNYIDDVTGRSAERTCRILLGLDGVVEHFFDGQEKEHLKRIVVDPYVSGIVWEIPEKSPYKAGVEAVCSPKNCLYRKYFIPPAQRRSFFQGKKFIIYGTGTFGKRAYEELRKYNADIVGAADSADSKRGSLFGEFIVMTVEEMVRECRKRDVYIVVANHLALKDMTDTLLGYGIEQIGIIT